MDAGSRRRPLGRVIVVGSINQDLVVRVPRLPRAGETVTGGTFARHHGGKGANQAVAAARAGGTVHMLGAVGDSDGQACVDALAAEGVDITAVARLPGEHTGHALVIVDASGENQIAVAPGANTAVTPGHIRHRIGALTVTSDDVVVLSFELMDAPLLEAAAVARQVGATLLINPAPARECDPALLRGAVLTPNRRELMALAAGDEGAAPPPGTRGRDGTDSRTQGGADGTGADAALSLATSALARRTGGPVVATLGREGALLADGARLDHVPGYRVAARDTTGAGDTLTGVLATGLAAGSGLRTALRRAVAAAALTVTRVGAREGMPTAGQIDALLANGR